MKLKSCDGTDNRKQNKYKTKVNGLTNIRTYRAAKAAKIKFSERIHLSTSAEETEICTDDYLHKM